MAPVVISRYEAKAKGLVRYFTGKPCKHGHIAERQTSNGVCTACSVDIEKRYNDAHPEKVREKRRLQAARHRLENPERIKRNKKKWADANPEKIKAKGDRWRKANPERQSAIEKRYRVRHPDKLRVKNKTYKTENADRLRPLAIERAKKWAKENPERKLVQTQTRRARKKAAPGSHTAEEITALLEAQRHLCMGCSCSLTRKNRTIDHKTPLSRGGSNDITNLQWLCKSCNSSKHDKEYAVWLAEIGLIQLE